MLVFKPHLFGGEKCCLGLRKLETFSCIIRVWAWVCFLDAMRGRKEKVRQVSK